MVYVCYFLVKISLFITYFLIKNSHFGMTATGVIIYQALNFKNLNLFHKLKYIYNFFFF